MMNRDEHRKFDEFEIQKTHVPSEMKVAMTYVYSSGTGNSIGRVEALTQEDVAFLQSCGISPR